MCFAVIAGRNTTTTGTVIMASNDDWPGCPGHTHFIPHKFHKNGDTFLTVKGVQIPQPAETFGYVHTACAYETGTRHISWSGGLNENKVSVAMVGSYVFRNNQRENDLLEADDVTILIMERGKTARQAITMIGELIEQYGYTVSSIDGAEGTVSMAVADPEEGFFLELIPGGQWVAKRVADDEVECRPNCFGTQEIDFEDHVHFLYSKNLRSFAVENGWYKEGTPFNFTEIYGMGKNISEGYGRYDNPVNTMRKWNCLNYLCKIDIDPLAPIYHGKPDRKLSVMDMMNVLRDTMEGTKHDMAARPEAGPHHNPLWMTINTSVGQGGTVVSMVFDVRANGPADIGGCMWVASAASKVTCYVPAFVAGEGLPEAYTIGECGEYDLDSAWWAFEELFELSCRNYDEIAKGLIIPTFKEMEERFLAEREGLEKELSGLGTEERKEKIRAFSHRCADEAYEKALELGKYIKGKYLCNTVLDWL